MPEVTAEVIAQLTPTGALRAGINMSNFLLVVDKTEAGDPIGPSPSIARPSPMRWAYRCSSCRSRTPALSPPLLGPAYGTSVISALNRSAPL